MTRAEYSVALSRALHRVVLSHSSYAILVVLRSGRAAVVSEIGDHLGLSYHAVVWHLRKHPDLFTIKKDTVPHRVEASDEGTQLVQQIEELVARYAQDSAPSRPATIFRPVRSSPAAKAFLSR
jgi:hypothetical protein